MHMAEELGGLRKLERDADVDAVSLATYWNRPVGQTEAHPLCADIRDLHFKAEVGGSGCEASVERFVRYAAEEKKRHVLVLSTYRRSLELKGLVVAAYRQQCSGQCDAGLAAQILGTRPQLKTVWSVDTCRRYLLIVDRFNEESAMIMDR